MKGVNRRVVLPLIFVSVFTPFSTSGHHQHHVVMNTLKLHSVTPIWKHISFSPAQCVYSKARKERLGYFIENTFRVVTLRAHAVAVLEIILKGLLMPGQRLSAELTQSGSILSNMLTAHHLHSQLRNTKEATVLSSYYLNLLELSRLSWY